MLRILGRTSSINVRKVLWTAAEVGADFSHEDDWAEGRSTRSPEFLRLNPHGLVPVIVDDEAVLSESNTICRYLAAKARRTDLLPDPPLARAQVERWMDWQAIDLNTAWRSAFYALVRGDPAYSADTAMIARSIEDWNVLMLRLENRLGETGAYVCGETFTLADVVLGLSLQRWLKTPMARPATPALMAYRHRLMERPAAAASIDPETP